jgi:hypothetical protein
MKKSNYNETFPTIPSACKPPSRVFAVRPPARQRKPQPPRPLKTNLPKITPHWRKLEFRDTPTARSARAVPETRPHKRKTRPCRKQETAPKTQAPSRAVKATASPPRAAPPSPAGSCPRSSSCPAPSPVRRSHGPPRSSRENVRPDAPKFTPETAKQLSISGLYSCKTKLSHFPSITCRHNSQPNCKISIPVKRPQPPYLQRFTDPPQNRVQPQYSGHPPDHLCGARKYKRTHDRKDTRPG